MSFSDNLKIIRKSKGFSQAELAKNVGISQAALAQFELGIRLPNIITAVRLEKALGTTCRELVESNSAETKGEMSHAE